MAAIFVQRQLFEDDYRVFYDPAMRDAPITRKAYLDAEHVTVVYQPRRPLDLDHWMAAHGITRHFRIMVPGFAGITPFLRGTTLLATVLGGYAPTCSLARCRRQSADQMPAHADVSGLAPPLPRRPSVSLVTREQALACVATPQTVVADGRTTAPAAAPAC